MLFAVQLGIGLVYVWSDFRGRARELQTRIERQGQLLRSIVAENLLAMNFLALEQLMAEANRDPDIVYSLVTRPDGAPLTRVVDFDNALIQKTLKVSADAELDLIRPTIAELLPELRQRSELKLVKIALIAEGDPLGYVEIGYSLQGARQQFYQQALLLLGTTLIIALSLAAITIALFSRKVSQPTARLVDLAQDLASGHFDAINRYPLAIRNDEIGQLTSAFLAMAAQLRSTLNGLQERNQTLAVTNAELERATRLKSDFLANMSHELRTPLNAVLGLSQALLTEVYGTLTDRQQVSLQRIQDSGSHLLALIQDILDLAKIESGKEEIVLQQSSVSHLCHSSIEIVQALADAKQIDLQYEIKTEENLISLDERRMRQVLINLLNNAIKFTPEGGMVRLEVRGSIAQGQIEFELSDTGIGIAEADMPHLFESFVQLEAGLSRRHEGTGLGLTLVRHLVEMHGGSIRVSSEVGAGSQFCVTLPWNQPQDAEPSPGLPHPEDGEPDVDLGIKLDQSAMSSVDPLLRGAPQLWQHPTNAPEANSSHGGIYDAFPSHDRAKQTKEHEQYLILIAEDNPHNIAMLSDFLAYEGYKLIFAKNGYEALELARIHQPQLILMDIHMPRMSGLEAVQRLRADPKLRQILIVAVTALATQGDQKRCLDAGFDHYIIKPIDLVRLSSMITALLQAPRPT